MKKVITTAHAPAAIGPYSQAVSVGNLVYTSGQIALIPSTGMMEQSSLERETIQVMENLKAVLAEAGIGFDKVIKTTIFLKDMDDFAAVNALYATYFTDSFPARETVQVARLPKDARVEISMIGYL